MEQHALVLEPFMRLDKKAKNGFGASFGCPNGGTSRRIIGHGSLDPSGFMVRVVWPQRR